MVNETGSRLARSRVCMTQAQWDEQSHRTQSSIERAQTSQVQPPGH
jgi:hypothetical protein